MEYLPAIYSKSIQISLMLLNRNIQVRPLVLTLAANKELIKSIVGYKVLLRTQLNLL
jgi:hypothetical protein